MSLLPTLLLAGAAFAQATPDFDVRIAAGEATRARKILMVRFEPTERAAIEELDRAIARDAQLAADFAKTFHVQTRPLNDVAGDALHKELGSPFRGTWPGIALVDRAGGLLSVVDASAWQTDGKWDPARVRQFVDFWATPLPKNERLKQCKEKYGPIYDAKADAKAEVAAAVAEAKAEGKHVLVKIGGNWCGWCYFLHDEFETKPKLRELLEQNYVLVRVNHDQEQKNEALLAEFEQPQRFGFPVLIVLDGNGRRLHTQDSGILEVGDHHDPRQVEQFLRHWTPKALLPRK